MNILPKKRWHVRTKDNIARVRKDEALAAEEEKKKQLRIQIAEKEARIETLREKAKQQYGKHIPESSKALESQPLPNKHINFFYDQNEMVNNKPNEDYEKEKKLEKEKYEKQIGYLTYLGQDTNEITGQVSWYNKPKDKNLNDHEEVSKKQKIFEDPLEDIRKYLGCDGIKKINESVESKKSDLRCNISHKKYLKNKKSKHKKKRKKKKYSSESEAEVKEEEVIKQKFVDLERLRSERMKREKEERKRADEVFAKLNGISVIKREDIESETHQKYSLQFHPHLAKQNFVNK